MIHPEGEIRQPDRLVPIDFKPDVKVELIAALNASKPEKGYPLKESRLKMTEDQITNWVITGRKQAMLF